MGAVRLQAIALVGVVERNTYLIKRYGLWARAFVVWTVANTLTIVFIADGVEAAGGTLNVERQTTILLIGAVIWAYLGIVFEILPRRSPGSAGRARSSTRSWRRCRGPCTCSAWARSPSCTASCAPRCCSRSWACSSC